MTQETPAKVMSFLGVALTSMFFLFMVTVTNASFEKMETPFPDPFSPDKVVAWLDNTAHDYDSFVTAYFTQPLQNDVAFYSGVYKDNLAWVIENSDQQILSLVGLEQLAQVEEQPAPVFVARSASVPAVAGAYTSKAVSQNSLGLLQALYAVFTQ